MNRTAVIPAQVYALVIILENSVDHKYHDICITDVDFSESEEEEILKIKIDTSKDDAKFDFLLLTKKDVVELARHLKLVIYEKNSSL